MLLPLVLALLLSFGFAVDVHLRDLERGDVLKPFERLLKGNPTEYDLYLIKSFAQSIKEQPPEHFRLFVMGLLAEKRGRVEEALKNYLLSIEKKPDYNPSYFRFNELIRKVKNPDLYRSKMTFLVKERFSKAPPVLVENPEDRFVFLVEKMSQYLLVFKGKKLVELYPVTTGRDWEDKWREGDRRTTEGVYYFTRFNLPLSSPRCTAV